MHVINPDQIQQIANDIDINRILRTIEPTKRKAWPRRAEAFPPLNRPIQQVPNWWASRGNPAAAERHSLLYAIARTSRPWMIGTIGVGWGAELMCLAQGGYDCGYTDLSSNGYDDEALRPGCLEWVRECFMAKRMSYNLSHSSMVSYLEHGLPLSNIDIFHLEAEYCGDNLGRDLMLALHVISAKGFAVITGNDACALRLDAGEEFSGRLCLANSVMIVCRPSQIGQE